MVNTFDVGFEEYIIFHRGISRLELRTEDNVDCLYAIYQDGYEQRLGDPYGDGARDAADDANNAKDDAEAALATINSEYEDVLQKEREVAESLVDAQNKYDAASALNDEAAEKLATVDYIQDTISDRLEAVTGMEYDTVNNVYYVDFPPAISSAEINALFGLT